MDRDIDELAIACETDTAEFEEAFSGSRGRAIPFELALMAAALRWAIFERDTAWINSDEEHVFSFRNCCESLGIDHLAARKAPKFA
jgi:hypothetical protein